MSDLQVFQETFNCRQNILSKIRSLKPSDRQKSLQLANDIGLPNKKNEKWKYTQASKLFAHSSFGPVESQEPVSKVTWAHGPSIVFVNGVFSKDLSENIESHHLSILSLDEALDEEGKKRILENLSLTQKTENVFSALNSALFTGGVVIKVAQEKKVDEVIKITHFVGSEKSKQLAATKNFIWAKPLAQVRVLEEFISVDSASEKENKADSVTSSCTELIVEDKAHVEYVSWQNLTSKSVHIQNITAQMSHDSRANIQLGFLGSRLSRTDLKVNFKGTHSSVQTGGVSVLNGQQHIDVYSDLNHCVEHTQSQQLFKGVLADSSRNIFTGRQYIAEDAQKVNSTQLSKNLLLSDRAEADSRPQLEVNADDVKATHGAAIGQLNFDELFYLMSRAISKNEAFSMLAGGYALEVVEKIQSAEIREHLKPQVYKKLSALSKKSWA